MITDEDRAFLAYIKKNKHIGYGRMMQIISNEWYCIDESGAQIPSECVAFLSQEDKITIRLCVERERLQGMDYS